MNSGKSRQGKATFQWGYTVTLLLAFPLTILARGYIFPYANHGQEIPPIMARIDPSLFINDFAIQSFLSPGVRFYYQHIIAFMVGNLGFSFSGAYGLLYSLALVSFIAGILCIAYYLSTISGIFSVHAHFTMAAVLLFWSLSPLYSWGSAIMPSSALPSTFAMGIAIWGIYNALKGRWILTYALFGLAAILQFLVGFLPGLVFGPAFLRDTIRQRNWGQGGLAMTLWGTGLAVVYIPMAINSQATPANFDFLSVFGLYRVPHHWVPSTANAVEWLSDTALVIATLALSWDLYRKGNATIRPLALLCGYGLVVATLAVIANYLFVEVWPITLIGKLQFQRIMPFGHLCAMMLLFVFSVALWRQKQYGSLIVLIVSPLFMLWGLIVTIVVSAFLLGKAKERWGQTGLLLISLIISPMLHTAWHLLKGNPSVVGTGFSTSPIEVVFYLFLLILLVGIGTFISLRDGLFRNVVMIFGTIGLFAFTWMLFRIQEVQKTNICIGNKARVEKIVRVVNNRFSWNKMYNTPLASLAEALRVHTEPDQIVMLPPWGPFDYFQMISQRPAYFSHKTVPYTDYDVWLWSERGAKLLGTKLRPFMTEKEIVFLFSHRSAHELASIAQQEGIYYIISRKDWHGDMPGTLIAEDGYGKDIWALWRLDGYQTQNNSFKREKYFTSTYPHINARDSEGIDEWKVYHQDPL